jgi:hypothetical protein
MLFNYDYAHSIENVSYTTFTIVVVLLIFLIVSSFNILFEEIEALKNEKSKDNMIKLEFKMIKDDILPIDDDYDDDVESNFSDEHSVKSKNSKNSKNSKKSKCTNCSCVKVEKTPN